MSVPVSPNMNLPLPVPGVTPGPLWATLLNTADSIIDTHNHTFGQGVQIPSAGININAPLPFNTYGITGMGSVIFNPLASLATAFALYASGTDLFFNAAGGPVNISSPNAAAGGWVGLPSGTAAAKYGSGIFSLFSASTTPGQLNIGNLVLFDETAGATDSITIKAPALLANTFTLTLPGSAPVSASFPLVASSGVITWGSWDGTTIQLSGQNLQVGTIGNANLGTRIVNATNLAVGANGTGVPIPRVYGEISISSGGVVVAAIPGRSSLAFTTGITATELNINWTDNTAWAPSAVADLVVSLVSAEQMVGVLYSFALTAGTGANTIVIAVYNPANGGNEDIASTNFKFSIAY